MAAFLYNEGMVKIILSNTESAKGQIFKYKNWKTLDEARNRSTASYFIGNKNGEEILDYLDCKNREFVIDITKTKDYIKNVDPLIKMLGISSFMDELVGYKEAKEALLKMNTDPIIGKVIDYYPEVSDTRCYIRFRDERQDNFKKIIIAMLCDLVVYHKGDKNYIYPIIKENILGLIASHLDFKNEKLDLDITIDNIAQSTVIGGYNKIYYGIPGCGKSYHVEHNVLKNVDDDCKFRTTFYLDYTYTDFVGQVFPVVEGDKVTYKNIPGPFTKALAKAINTPEKMVYLIVEEINRGNAAAIFGDLFQLLDRDEDGNSEYPITNEFIESYLKLNCETFNGDNIMIPSNLTIIATMNTSDQNVFPLDTAFKRRWEQERVIPNWEEANKKFEGMIVPGTNLKWSEFAKEVNNTMIKNSKDGMVLEDKQLGPFFIKKNALSIPGEAAEIKAKKLRNFVDTVISYLYSDVTKFDHGILFFDKKISYDSLYESILDYDLSSNRCNYGLPCIESILTGVDNEE